MYDEIFNLDDFENEGIDNSKGPIEMDIEFPTPKEGPSLDEMMRKYRFIIFKEWPKAKSKEVKKKNAGM